MTIKTHKRPKSLYNTAITKEPFLFYEMRTTAKLLNNGYSEKETIEKITTENLFQYPTERTIKSIAQACIRRLNTLNDPTLINAIAHAPSVTAKQICLYAMIKQYKIIQDFMITVIGEKYRTLDYTFTPKDLNHYMNRLQEQDNAAATWSISTIAKIKQVLKKILVETEYLDNTKSTKLNRIYFEPILERAIRKSRNTIILPAFNCF